MTVMPSTLDSFYTRCGELLDVASESVDATTGGHISRQFVTAGLPAFDCCPFLAVSGVSVGVDFAGGAGSPHNLGHAQRFQRSNLTGFVVWVVRCAPPPNAAGQPPTAARCI